MKLAGFNILDVIYSVDETVVARAEAANGSQLVLKYQNTSHPSLDLIARWRHEHDILQGISSEWVIKSYGLQQVDAIQVLLLEYFSSSKSSAWRIVRPLRCTSPTTGSLTRPSGSIT